MITERELLCPVTVQMHRPAACDIRPG
ncbi:hypothetical protein CTAM01_00676 [Colletotrichum tamarilloi]|uniref:Uncharacterized protein n=1 Tax=Colletotrichum tamarilloi TaxID=1209934 RepID=A0ABQ9RRW1_9PEZI|nr:hypothetical protein CTAM01_00676 [Colletotrichum tamarilloi]